eukprot:766530-Hanusia_phi.AAC.2
MRQFAGLGSEVFFLTGSDEHGQKIAATASMMKNGETEIELCDRHVKIFANLYDKLDISFDRSDTFIRTSSDDHKKVASYIFDQVLRAGDIYLGNYSGWYNVREEAFVPEGWRRRKRKRKGKKSSYEFWQIGEAENTNFTDPANSSDAHAFEVNGGWVRRFQEQIKQHILSHPEFIQPANARNDILQRLEVNLDPADASSSDRTSFSWGIPVPNDSKHVMYVWFDALINYLSGSCLVWNSLFLTPLPSPPPIQPPPALQIGVDWPDGARSSHWPCDVHLIGKDIIWFHAVIWPSMLISAGVQLPSRIFGHGFVNDRLGRKMSKSLNNVEDPFALLERYSDGKVPDALPVDDQPFGWPSLLEDLHEKFSFFALQDALDVVSNAVRITNKWLYDLAPWKLKEEKDKKRRAQIIRTLLEGIHYLAHVYLPFTPRAANKILLTLGTSAVALGQLDDFFTNLKPGSSIAAMDCVLFEKLALDAAGDSEEQAGGRSSKEFPLDIRVGEVKEQTLVDESLQLLQVDVGDKRILQVVTRVYDTSLERCSVGNKVCLLLNVNGTTFQGYSSEAMLLCGQQSKPTKAYVIPPTSLLFP